MVEISGYMSSQYVNTMNCNVYVGVGGMGVGRCLGVPIMHKILGLAIHWHGGLGHVHISSQLGIVMSGG